MKSKEKNLKVMWISPFAPYDNINHASGKIENYYLKNLKQSSEQLEIKLISFCEEQNRNKLDLENYKIDSDIEYFTNDKKSKLYRNIKYNGAASKLYIFDKYSNYVPNFFRKVILSKLKSCKNEFIPDLIILDWTSSVLIISEIKKIYPDAKYISIEQDVAYLSYIRKIDLCKNSLSKKVWTWKYKNLKRKELLAINISDKVICNNEKDKALLLEEGIENEKIIVWSPFYYDYTDNVKKYDSKTILFYGAMSRYENYMSAIWFIENVFNKIDNSEMQFVVIGANPPNKLKKYESERIKILGFVEDVGEYLDNAMCLVAPLVLGAGIKIKVLEAMSSGLPVLTNEIGIEGIPAKSGEEFILCKEKDDYLKEIENLSNNRKMLESISEKSKVFIKNNFNYEKSLLEFIGLVNELGGQKN